MRFTFLSITLAGAFVLAGPADTAVRENIRNDQAVKDVVAGKLARANAAWWGFHDEDSTGAIQSAIDSGAKTVVIPFLGRPWIVRPITLRSNQEILFEAGVLVLAKKGEFRGSGDSLFHASGISNLTMRGYGATLRMRKHDYQNPPYTKAEWRMGIAIQGCRNVRIEGLRVESSGGDGFYVDGGPGLAWSENVTLRDCVSYDNHRQGISVISAVNLLVENCTFSGTRGTAPEAGIDMEPDAANQRFVNCVIRNCVFENNHGHQMLVYLKKLSEQSEPVSIRFENCHARMTLKAGEDPGGWAGMSVGAVRDDGPRGLIEFVNCASDHTGREGAKIYDKSANGALVRFRQCSWSNSWQSAAPDFAAPRSPVMIHLRIPKTTQRPGGVEFLDCYVYDDVYRPGIVFYEDKSDYGLRDVHGVVSILNRAGAFAKLGDKLSNVDLQILDASK